MKENMSALLLVKVKKFFYLSIHLMFVSGILYAFYQFLRTPRVDMLVRRLWAYESWIILSFYGLFTYLILMDREYREATRQERQKNFRKFQRIMQINLLLLIFPWGLFLIFGPEELLHILGFYSVYWRVLGGFSLLGALLYAFPYIFYRNKLSYFVLLFGALDNFLAGMVVLVLFFKHQAPIVAFSVTPILFYFSYFFWDQARRYRSLTAGEML